MDGRILAGCIQAAATLIAARNPPTGGIDLDECARMAAELYEKVTGEKYEPPGRAQKPPGGLKRRAKQLTPPAAPPKANRLSAKANRLSGAARARLAPRGG
jgi:hypothetical protein